MVGAHNPPVGSEYRPEEEGITTQDAVDRIGALFRKAQEECYLPEDPERNHRNAGRVRALGQALKILEGAGFKPDYYAYTVTDDEEMEVVD